MTYTMKSKSGDIRQAHGKMEMVALVMAGWTVIEYLWK